MQLINFKSILTILAAFAAVASAVSDYVITLNDKNFDSVVNGERNVLVKFYATWCGPCKRLAPIIEAVSLKFPDPKGDVIIVQIDASKNRKIANRYDITGFPTMKFFPKGSKKPIEYDGKRTEESILSFIKRHAVIDHSSSKSQTQPGCEIGTAPHHQDNNVIAPLMSHTDVQQVDAAELRHILANAGDRPVIAFFYSPNCSHCHSFMPLYAEIAEMYSGAIFVKINGENNVTFRNQFKLTYYPSIVGFKAGSSGAHWQLYAGPRIQANIISFIRTLH